MFISIFYYYLHIGNIHVLLQLLGLYALLLKADLTLPFTLAPI